MPWSLHFGIGAEGLQETYPKIERHSHQNADIDMESSDDEGGNPKVAAVPHPSEDEEDA
jgi:hypothetical protein